MTSSSMNLATVLSACFRFTALHIPLGCIHICILHACASARSAFRCFFNYCNILHGSSEISVFIYVFMPMTACMCTHALYLYKFMVLTRVRPCRSNYGLPPLLYCRHIATCIGWDLLVVFIPCLVRIRQRTRMC